MSRQNPKQATTSPVIDQIAKHAYKRGVFFHLEADQDSPTAYTYEPSNKVLTVFTRSLSPEELEELFPIFSHYLEKYDMLVTTRQKQIFAEYEEFDESNPYQGTLEFFKGKIPERDLEALEMAFFMRAEKGTGSNIDQIKQDIRERFGNRGTYIANLCNAGFYDAFFQSMYNKFSREKFDEYYELKVGEELAALFVHTGLNLRAMLDSFQEKAAKDKTVTPGPGAYAQEAAWAKPKKAG